LTEATKETAYNSPVLENNNYTIYKKIAHTLRFFCMKELIAMKLTAKQKKFCDYFIELGNGTQAAIKAGYSEKTAGVIAQENLKKPAIMEYIAARTNGIENPLIASGDEILETLSEIMRSKRTKAADRIKAAEMLGRRALIWNDKRKADADLEKALAETELIKERTKLIKGAAKDTTLLEKLIETIEKHN
jgi:phage terminase small subunit